MKNNIVFIPFNSEINIIFDKEPSFTVVVSAYNSQIRRDELPISCDYFLSVRSECKGDLVYAQLCFIKEMNLDFDYVAMYDDDIVIRISEIEEMFRLAKSLNLDLFSPSLSVDSIYTWKFMVSQQMASGYVGRNTEWIEIMMPHFSKRFFVEFKRHLDMLFAKNSLHSGYGMDNIIFPLIVREFIGFSCAIIDSVIAKHLRPISSDRRVFSNGKTAVEEVLLIIEYVKQLDFVKSLPVNEPFREKLLLIEDYWEKRYQTDLASNKNTLF